MKEEYKGYVIKFSTFLNSCTFTTKENDEARMQNARLIHNAKKLKK